MFSAFVELMGYLTLLTGRRILSERHGYRIAVIMNDFGDTAVSSRSFPVYR